LEGAPRAALATFEHMVEDEPDPIFSYRMANMAALAALEAGDKTHALARWTDVARSRPLTWPALVARARLAAQGAPLPPFIDPPEISDPLPPLTIALPAPADLLHGLGLEADAEQALRAREAVVTRGAGSRSSEALCATYGELARARRRFQIAQSLSSALLAKSPWTVFVKQLAATPTSQAISFYVGSTSVGNGFGFEINTSRALYYSAVAILADSTASSGWEQWTATNTGSLSTLRVNGTGQTISNSTSQPGVPSATTFVGASSAAGGVAWNGSISHVIAYNSVLTAPQIAQVEAYLAAA